MNPTRINFNVYYHFWNLFLFLSFINVELLFLLAYYIIFLSYDNPNTPEEVDDTASNPVSSPTESVIAMFLMSMTNFGDYYVAFARTKHEMEAKVILLN